MRLRDDERGQSIQVGAVLLFGILVISFSTYQAVIVPDQNRGVEFDHNLQVHDEMLDLRNAIVSTPGGGSAKATSVTLGTRYPSRAVALNPPPVYGQLETVGTADPRVNVSITNATASGETGDVWNGSTRAYNSGGIVYKPGYNVYDDAPLTVYENTLLYNSFDSGSLVMANQTLVEDDEVSLVVVNGSLRRSATTATGVDTRPVSSSTETVQVTSPSDSPITINFTSRLSATEWERILSDEDRVVDVSEPAASVPGPFTMIQVKLRAGETYRLQLTKVGVGNQITDEDAAYLTDVEGNGTTVSRGEGTDLVLQVRDAYNNPVPGVEVAGEIDGSNAGSLSPGSATSDGNGRVEFTYEATDSTDAGDHDVRFSFDAIDADYDAETADDVTMTVTVPEDESGGGNGSDGAYGVSWLDPSGQSNVDCSTDPCTLDAAESRTAELTMETDPGAVGAAVDYAVGNATVGEVSPGDGETNASGQNATALTVSESGEILVYTSSGGAGDALALNVTDVDLELVAYVDGSTGDLNTVASDGTVTTYEDTEDVRAVGPLADLDDDGQDELTYVTNGNELRMVDSEGTTETLASDVAHSEASIAVGDGDEDGTLEAYYTDATNNNLHEVEYGATPQQVERTSGGNCNGASNPIQTPHGPAGVADFNDDGTANIVFASNADQVAYFDPNDCGISYPGAPANGIASGNGGVGIGEPFEYAAGDVRVPVVDNDNELVLVESDGTTTTLPSSYGSAAASALTVRDWDADGDLEVVHLDGSSSPYLLRHAGIEDGDLVTIQDDQNDDVTGERTSGTR